MSRSDHRILCVEDDAASRAVLAAALRDYGPDFAATGRDALATLNFKPYDLLVLDHWLPDYNGVGICREVRQHDPHVPIVFWTVADKDEHEAPALRAGADAYLEKSAEYEALRDKVAALLEHARRRRGNAAAAALKTLEGLRSEYASRRSSGEVSDTRLTHLVTRFGEPKARAAFLGAGGTKSQFISWWTEYVRTIR